MSRLPQPNGDDGTWGAILNDYLSVAHNSDGTLKASSVTAAAPVTSVAGLTGAVALAAVATSGSAADLTAGTLAIARMTSAGILYVQYDTVNSVWPARPTARTDIMVHWIGATESTPPTGALSGTDIWDRPA